MAKYFYTGDTRYTGLKVMSEIDDYKVVYFFGTGYAIKKISFARGSYFIRKLGYDGEMKNTMRVVIEPCKRLSDYKVTIISKEENGRRYEAERYLENEVPPVRIIANALIKGELGEDLAYDGEKMVTTWEDVHTHAVDFLLSEANRCEELAHDDMFYAGQRNAFVQSLQIMGYEMFGCNSDDLIVGRMADNGKYAMRRKVVRWEE